MAKKTAPKKTKPTRMMPALLALLIASLLLFAVVLTAGRVGSSKPVAPTAPESQPKAAELKRCGTNARSWYCNPEDLCGKEKGVCIAITPTPNKDQKMCGINGWNWKCSKSQMCGKTKGSCITTATPTPYRYK